MRWMMMGGHHMAGGFAAFMIFRMIRRAVMGLVVIGLVAAVIYFWARSRRNYDY